MNKSIFVLLMLTVLFSGFSCKQEKTDDFPIFKGKYLGQKTPGVTPEVFAESILNTKKTSAFCSVFSPDLTEFYTINFYLDEKTPSEVLYMKMIDSGWTTPTVAPFNSDSIDNDICMSYDGNTLIWRSWRALPDGKKPDNHSYLWFVERTENGWSRPKPLLCGGHPVRTGYPSITKDMTLYFTQKVKDRLGIYKSDYIDGKYQEPEYVYKVLEGKNTEGDIYVASDHSYLIITCWNHPDNTGGSAGDLYITFKKKDGTWSKAINMGEPVNSAIGDYCPYVTHDGEYLFFSRWDNEKKKGGVYWVDVKIIDELKPNNL